MIWMTAALIDGRTYSEQAYNTSRKLHDVSTEHIECCTIRLWTCTDYDVHGWARGEKACADKLAQSALESVASHSRSRIARDDDSNAWMSERGSNYPNVEMLRSDSLPLSHDSLDLGTASQPVTARKGEPWKRRRKPRT